MLTTHTDPSTKRTQLRELLSREGALVAPGVYDCLSAKIAQDAGAEAVIVTGAGVTASLLGTPDVGLLGMFEVVTHTKNIAACVDVPLIADCDTGYGNPIGVQRTIREFETAGVAALFIEDQVSPKRCGHFAGKEVIPAEDMVQKLHAAVDARKDPALTLIARTDAREMLGTDEAIRRARLYVEAGADMIFVEAPHTEDELATIARELEPLGVPLMSNLVEGGKTPMVPVARMAEMGFSLVTFSGSMQKTAISSMAAFVRSLLRTGEVSDFYPSAMVSLDERSRLLGLGNYFALEQRYSSRDSAR